MNEAGVGTGGTNFAIAPPLGVFCGKSAATTIRARIVCIGAWGKDMLIRESTADDREKIYSIINEAALAYRGIIPADRWHEPYMSREELDREISLGVEFWVAEDDGTMAGVMGIQDKGKVALVRHAYRS